MLPKEISSLQHPIVKMCVKLRMDRSFRYERKQIVLVGKKMISEVPNLDILFIKKGDPIPWQAKEVFIVPNAILSKISGVPAPESFVAIVSMPAEQTLDQKKWVLALDGLQDPGNLGTILRSALGLGWEGAFVSSSCVDPYNDKALRAAKGATFRLPLLSGGENTLLQLAKGRSVWIADSKGEPISRLSPYCASKGIVLVLGSESQGASPTLKKQFPLLSIPLKNMESLNVASAGAILLYLLKAQLREKSDE